MLQLAARIFVRFASAHGSARFGKDLQSRLAVQEWQRFQEAVEQTS